MHHSQAFATSYTAHSPRPTTSPGLAVFCKYPLIHLQYHCLGLLFRQCMILQILHLPTHSYFTGTTTGVTSPTTPTLTQYLSISRTISILLYKLQKIFFSLTTNLNPPHQYPFRLLKLLLVLLQLLDIPYRYPFQVFRVSWLRQTTQNFSQLQAPYL